MLNKNFGGTNDNYLASDAIIDDHLICQTQWETCCGVAKSKLNLSVMDRPLLFLSTNHNLPTLLSFKNIIWSIVLITSFIFRQNVLIIFCVSLPNQNLPCLRAPKLMLSKLLRTPEFRQHLFSYSCEKLKQNLIFGPWAQAPGHLHHLRFLQLWWCHCFTYLCRWQTFYNFLAQISMPFTVANPTRLYPQEWFFQLTRI